MIHRNRTELESFQQKMGHRSKLRGASGDHEEEKGTDGHCVDEIINLAARSLGIIITIIIYCLFGAS